MKRIIAAVLILAAAIMPLSVSAQLPQTEKLVLCWDCNENSGMILGDSSKYRIRGRMTEVGREQDGDGGCLKFSYENNGRINFGTRLTDVLTRGKGMTFAAWLKLPAEDTSARRYRFFGTYIGGVVGSEIYYWPNQGSITVGLRSCPQDSWLSNTYNVELTGEWMHLAVSVSYKEKFCRLYINGCEVAPKSGSEYMAFKKNYYDGITTTKYDYIGGDGAASMEGLMDEVRVYRDALAKEDIVKLAASKDITPGESLAAAEEAWEKKKIMNGIMPDYIIMNTGKSHYFKYNGIAVCDKNYILKPYEENAEVFVPVTALAEALGYTAEENDGGIVLSKENEQINLRRELIEKDGGKYLPLKSAAETFGIEGYASEQGLIAFGEKNLGEAASKDSIAQIENLFADELYPEPVRNHAATRVVVAHEPKETGQYIGSPSIIRLDGDTLLASHDFFGSAVQAYKSRVYRSDDNGKTWNMTAELDDLYWASMFECGGSVYLLGATKPGGSIVIRKSGDGGYSWTDASDGATGILFQGEDNQRAWYHAGSTPVLKANGRVYKGFENGADPDSNWRHKYAFVVSAPEDSNLLNAENWTMSNQIMLDQSRLPSEWETNDTIWIEGNAVKGRGGQLYNIMRLETQPTVNKAAVMPLSAEGESLEFDYETGFIEFPGGASLFNIDYDAKTDRYIALVNTATDADTNPNQRNILQLSYSEDLVHWNIAETILIDDFSGLSWEKSMEKIGFQYVDWIFDGDDIILLVREATGDHNYHNANYLTVYTIKNYAKYIK